MKLVEAEWPAEPRTKDTKTASIGLAAVLVVMATAQLFRLDNFIPLLDSFGLPGVPGRAAAVVLTVSSVMALPFLLRMKLSVGFRYLSMFAGWLAIAGWLMIATWLNLSDVAVDNVGLLGSEVTLIPGLWAIFVTLALAILMAWSSWGLWPGGRRPAKEVDLKLPKAAAKPKSPARKRPAKVRSSRRQPKQSTSQQLNAKTKK